MLNVFKKIKGLIKKGLQKATLNLRCYLCACKLTDEVETLFQQIQTNGGIKTKTDSLIVRHHFRYLGYVNQDSQSFLIEVYDWLNDRELDVEIVEDLIMVAIKVVFENTTEKYGLDHLFKE